MTTQAPPRYDPRYDPRPAGAAGGRAWWTAGLGVAAVGWGAQQFTPLLLMYQARLGLTATTVQATFGFYVLGLVPGLLLGGPVSDRYGRRWVTALAVGVSAAGTALLILGGAGVGWLYGGRLVAGVASGAAFSAGAAWIKELSGPSSSGARRVTVAMTVGFGLGPLVAGVLAQWAPAPTLLPYLPHLALAGAALPLAVRTPETTGRHGTGSLLRRLRVPEAGERRFRTVVLPLGLWVFTSAAVSLAYLPGLVMARLGGHAVIFSAVVVLLTAAAGILVQPLARRLDRPDQPRLLRAALGTVLAGMLAAAAAAATAQPALVLAAAPVLGAGYGGCQVCGLLEVQRLARPDRLAALTAVYQAVSYLGFAAPLPLAAASGAVPPPALLLAVAALVALTLAWTTRYAASGDRAAGGSPRNVRR
jgi:MFS family permease